MQGPVDFHHLDSAHCAGRSCILAMLGTKYYNPNNIMPFPIHLAIQKVYIYNSIEALLESQQINSNLLSPVQPTVRRETLRHMQSYGQPRGSESGPGKGTWNKGPDPEPPPEFIIS